MNTCRKLVLLFMNTFLEDSMYKALYCSGILLAFFFVQQRVEPYKESFFNSLEQREMVASLTFLFGGILFTYQEQSAIMTIIMILVFLVVNTMFFAMFMFILTKRYEAKFPILNLFSVIFLKLALYTMTEKELDRIKTRS